MEQAEIEKLGYVVVVKRDGNISTAIAYNKAVSTGDLKADGPTDKDALVLLLDRVRVARSDAQRRAGGPSGAEGG